MGRGRLAAAALGLAALAAGLVWTATRPAERERSPYELVIRDSAARAAREADVELEPLLRESIEEVLDRLPSSERRVRIEVRVEADQTLVIPETGYGGRAGTDVVFISVERPLRDGAETWLPAIVAHELHHVSRFRRRPPSLTLAEALVAEGLADHFAEEVFPATPPQPWDIALSGAQESVVWRRAEAILAKRRGYDHAAWFFGATPDLPRWAGYTLGFRIVGSYLGDERSAAAAVGVDPAVVIRSYGGR